MEDGGGATMCDVVDRLQIRTVPPGYTPHPLTSGQCVCICCVLKASRRSVHIMVDLCSCGYNVDCTCIHFSREDQRD